MSLTRREIPIALLDLGVPTLPLHRHIPQRFRGLTLREDESDADHTDDEKARDQKTQEPHLDLHAFANDAQDEQDDGDLAEAGTHDVEGLGRPIELDGHDALMSVQVVDVGAGAVVDLGGGDAHEDEGEQLGAVYQGCSASPTLGSSGAVSTHKCDDHGPVVQTHGVVHPDPGIQPPIQEQHRQRALRPADDEDERASAHVSTWRRGFHVLHGGFRPGPLQMNSGYKASPRDQRVSSINEQRTQRASPKHSLNSMQNLTWARRAR